MTKRNVLSLMLLITVVAFSASAQSVSPVPADVEIRKILVQRIDESKQAVGIVVGVVEPSGRRIVSYGALAKDDKRPLDGNTIFEIGSITKVFTSLLLADMVERGEVALTDPISKYLPANVKVPERNGRSITLQDLSNHTSGLPRLPANLGMKDQTNPYADYTVDQLYQFLSSYTLPRDIGSQYEYSNLGGGLLGHVLTRRAGMDYEALVRSRITGPLKMSSTAIALSTDMRARFAAGHNETLTPVSNWDLPTLAGAGALRSSTNDLMNFVSANLGLTESPLAPAMARMLTVRRSTGGPGVDIALGWHIFTSGGRDIIWHNGGTGGYRTFIGFDPKARVGVVVLSNTSTTLGVDDIGRHLLDPASPLVPVTSPLLQPAKTHTEITMDPKKFDAHVGRYQFTPEVTLTITREETHFFGQLTGQPKFEMFAEADHDFFLKAVDAQIKFEVDSSGLAQSARLYQLGRIQRATRFEAEPQQIWFGRKVAEADMSLWDRFVGRYQLTPQITVTIIREDSHLYGQLTGQPKYEMFPAGGQTYFLKVTDAEFLFEVNEGRVAAAILRQGGRDQRAPRVE
jgi:CubicO group peptidase (beta-lactamase class C family)